MYLSRMKRLGLRQTTHKELEAEELAYMRSLSPQERLDLLEHLRQEGARLGYYEYPDRLERVITITRKT